MVEQDATIEEQLRRFTTPRIEGEESQTGVEDRPIRISPVNIPRPENIVRIDTETMNVAERGEPTTLEPEQINYDKILKYGGVATGLIALGGLGMMVLNKQTADAAENLYGDDEEEFDIKPVKKEQDNMSEKEKNKMSKYAKMVQVVYDRRKAGGTDFFGFRSGFRKRDVDIPNQDVEGYTFERTGNDLTGAFVNDEKKEVVLAMRGLMPLNDRSDLLQFPAMSVSTALEEERGDAFGSTFRADRKMLEEIYLQAKELYPEYNIITTGHSRGGRGSIYLGRKYGLEFHAFSPATNRGDLELTSPSERGNHYYNSRDPVSRHMASKLSNTVEQHYLSYNNRLYPHSLVDFQRDGEFHNSTIFVKQPKTTRAVAIKEEEEIIEPEELTVTDLGRFADVTVPEINNAPILETGYGKITDSGIFVNVNSRPVSKFKPNVSLFDAIDRNNDNEITRAELKAFYPDLSDEEIDRLFKVYDKDNSQTLNRSEFELFKI